jgi:hypothetical protein
MTTHTTHPNKKESLQSDKSQNQSPVSDNKSSEHVSQSTTGIGHTDARIVQKHNSNTLDPNLAIGDSIPNDDQIDGVDADNTLRNLFFIIVFIIFSLSVLFFAVTYFSSNEPAFETYDFNGYTFTKQDISWSTNAYNAASDREYYILMYYGPREVENIALTADFMNYILSRDFIYLALNETALDSNQMAAQGAIAGIELGKVIGTKNNILNKETRGILVGTVENTDEFSCDQVNSSIGMIVFTHAESTQVILSDDNCIYVQGPNGAELVRAADRLMLHLVGIMP